MVKHHCYSLDGWVGLIGKTILILSNLHKYKMAATENEPEVIILLSSASNWPINTDKRA